VSLLLVGALACGDSNNSTTSAISNSTGSDAGTQVNTKSAIYARTDLVADRPGQAPVSDGNPINPWGLAYGPDTPFWIGNNGTGTMTVYNGDGEPQPKGNPLVVSLPVPKGSSDSAASPTGVVYHDGDGFEVSVGGDRASSRFLIATEQGTIIGWSPDLTPEQGIIVVDESAAGAIFKGVALSEGRDRRLYATDFHNGVVRVYDSQLKIVKDLAKNPFVDPKLPAGYAPFGIHTIDGHLFVTFAEQDADKKDDVHGGGKGYVSEFKADGSFVDRVASKGSLNAPWAVLPASDGFGKFHGALLISNFGDGTIHAYDRKSHKELGALSDKNGAPLAIDGLWGLAFGDDKQAGRADTLYFTAGPNDESHGVFGKIEVP